MHLRKYILATLLIFVLASCYREQDLDRYRNEELSNMLTLNSLVSADSTVQVAATKPYFFSDVHKGRTFVTDLDIAVSINGEEKEHMTYDANRHLYVSNTKVIPGESVTVSTRYRDKTVTATDVMPEPVVIEGISVSRQGPMQIYTDADCVVYYNLTFTDKPGDFVKKPMRDCTGKEICMEWLYHIGVPTDQIEELAEHSANTVPVMMPYIDAFFMPRAMGDRPDIVPEGAVNFAFLGQFADTPRDTVFTTEYSVRTAMEAVYGLLGVDRGVPEVWGSVYDVRELLQSSVHLMDGKSPLEVRLPGPLELLKKPLLRAVRGTVIEKVLRDQDVLRDGM